MDKKLENAEIILVCDALTEAAERWTAIGEASAKRGNTRVSATRLWMAKNAREIRDQLINCDTITLDGVTAGVAEPDMSVADWTDERLHKQNSITWEMIHGKELEGAIKAFPDTFGLRGHEGTFRISRASSYTNESGVHQLVIQIMKVRDVLPEPVRSALMEMGDEVTEIKWEDFSRGTPAELAAQVVLR